MIQKIVPFLWFDDQAEEAAKFYISIFENSEIVSIMRPGKGGLDGLGSLLSVNFQLEGQEFTAFNGGPQYKFTPAISLFVNCETQEEVDELWEKLSQGGEEQGPGWIKDQFGLYWQIVPTILGELINDPDPDKSQRVMNAMLQMEKLDIEKLIKAHRGP